MADIRINSLPTTASASSSDDFLALDGATNGTRKLNAYSPTFGGNLTVSGTTASTNDTSGAFQVVGGAGLKTSAYINTNGDTGRALVVGPVAQSGGNLPYASIKTSASFADFALCLENPNTTAGQGNGLRIVAGSAANDFPIFIKNQANSSTLFSVSGTGAGALAGNLTVSGTGNNVFRGPIRWGNTSYPGNNGYISEASTNSGLFPAIARNLIGSTGSNYTIADGAYGYYSGFEFSSDIRWFADTGTFTTGQSLVPTERMRLTYQGNFLIGTAIDGGQKLQVAGTVSFTGDLYSASAGSTWGADSGATGFLVYGAGGGANANKLVFRTNSTTALTLDSSQNATFAGNVTIAASKVFTHNGQNGYTLALSTTADRAFKFEGSSSGNDYTTSFTNAGAGKHNLSCSGSIAIGNTVQTAAAVASTHKVTISIGGSTYYLLATNV